MPHPDLPRCKGTGNKISFPSSAAAQAELARAQALRARGEHGEGKEGRVEIRSYPCLKCGGHHLTADSEPQPTRRQKRR